MTFTDNKITPILIKIFCRLTSFSRKLPHLKQLTEMVQWNYSWDTLSIITSFYSFNLLESHLLMWTDRCTCGQISLHVDWKLKDMNEKLTKLIKPKKCFSKLYCHEVIKVSFVTTSISNSLNYIISTWHCRESIWHQR